ncbi:hypothetical protein C8N24_0274 [Solirubrobacter pauli]|uniref:Uncharacterized protein n=1 Tax=Solirubrobacter pauli TaxID=166793 RepID=A0A660L960_9ACTN|nr:hypothetical protein C8N24_0274 [Solirubrobacter pauli]
MPWLWLPWQWEKTPFANDLHIQYGQIVSVSDRAIYPGQADRVVDAIKASADVEFNIAERLSGKARQAFALAAGMFTVAQAVALGAFRPGNVNTVEARWILGFALAAVIALAAAALTTVKADATVVSGDLSLDLLEDELNLAYTGDQDVVGRIGTYYLGVVRSRREANTVRRRWYRRVRVCVVVCITAIVSELVVSLAARMA